MGDWTVLSKMGCGFCDKAKALLARMGLPFAEVRCEDGEELRSELEARSCAAVPEPLTFPQIIDPAGALVPGGFAGLAGLLDPSPSAEPLLAPNPNRFTPFPIEDHEMWDMYKRATASFWVADEIALAQDVTDWETKLTANERFFVEHVLAFFASSDGIVQENLAGNFLAEVQCAEARQFLSYQIFSEAVHSETYGLLIDTLIKDEAKKATLFRAISEVPAVKAKAAWAMKWLDASSKSFAERLVAFVCVEGILFSGSFCAIYWLKNRGLMPGLGLSNQFISRDEGLHQQFGTLMYRRLVNRLPATTVEDIVREAVDNEKAFIIEAIPCGLIGMNSALMSQYIEFVADRLLTELGYGKVYGAQNPFPWMQLISLSAKDNFFERFASEYQRAGVMASAEDQVFGLASDF